MFHTRVCEIFGIKYPIVQSPMNYAITPALVAGVSNAGGLGTIASNMQIDIPPSTSNANAEHMRSMIREVRKLTNKPFGINIQHGRVINPEGKGLERFNPQSLAVMRVAIEERVPVAYISMAPPDSFVVETLHDAGMKVMLIGTTVRHGKRAEEAGVDAYLCAGYDAGGHSPGHGDTTLFTELPQVVDALKIPVMAGGCVGDARGLIAAFALGAEGIAMGTRFLATYECRWSQKTKQALINAHDGATVAWGKILGTGLGRTLKNRFTEMYFEMEMKGATAAELQAFIDGYKAPSGRGLDRKAGAYFDADLEWGEVYMGMVSGLIKDIKHAGDVVKDIMAEAERVVARLGAERMPARL
ncbi:MAG: nitronate monooxygenase [Chloroflexi bacterium]|nr:nitronate monooxygenase [Chloroflexota bacterium]